MNPYYAGVRVFKIAIFEGWGLLAPDEYVSISLVQPPTVVAREGFLSTKKIVFLASIPGVFGFLLGCP